MIAERSPKRRVAYLVSHPIQYQAPLLRYITQNSAEIDLTTFFLSDFSVGAYKDTGFGGKITWDVPLLDGYRHEFLPALTPKSWRNGLCPVNVGLHSRLRAGQFDVLWLHGYAHLTNLRAWTLARNLKIPVLIRAESQAGSVMRSAATRGIKEALLQSLFRQTAGFLAIGSRNRDYYRSFGVPENRIWEMPYAVDNAFFQSRLREVSSQRESLRQALGLSPERPILLYASKMTARKRPGDILEAYRRLSPDGKQEPLPYLLFIGDGAERSTLEAQAKSTGWSSIRFLGFKNQSELPAFFDLCDVFILISEREPWGLIINEIMNAGKPVIISDGVASGDDLVRDGENGYIVSVGDISATADRLQRLLIAPDARERAVTFGEESRKRIDQWSFREDLSGLEAAVTQVTKQKVPASVNAR
jgi:glycosyltransferase involved in cell wall biosynthesis